MRGKDFNNCNTLDVPVTGVCSRLLGFKESFISIYEGEKGEREKEKRGGEREIVKGERREEGGGVGW